MYSFFIKNIVLPAADLAMQTRVYFFYKQIKKMNKYSSDEIENWQNKKLQELINHAYQNTQYYRELFEKLNLTPDDIQRRSDLKKIPILTKEIIKNNYEKLIPSNIQNIKHKYSSTGGSSGDPLKFNLDLDSWSYITANTIFYWEKFGYKYGDKFLAVGSTSLFVNDKKSLKHKLYYRLKNKIGVNGVDMSDDIIKGYVELIKTQKIKFIYGYASAIYLIAKYVIRKKITLNITSVFPTSEILTDTYRNDILKGFNCNIVDGYGAHDGGISAFETTVGSFEVGYNTIFRIENLHGNIGDVLLTNLHSYSMPFINYSVGDKIEVSLSDTISSGYNGQLLRKVYGRTSDVFNLENGKVLTGPGFTILFKDLNVDAYKIEKIGVLHLRCTIIKNSSFIKEEEKIILDTFTKQAGEDCKISLKYVNEFPLLKSGKKQYFCTN